MRLHRVAAARSRERTHKLCITHTHPCMPGGSNKKWADTTGSIFQKVDDSAGVTWDDYKAAREKLKRRCSCE